MKKVKMNTNRSLLLTSGLLLGVTAIAMSGATYAWFITQRKATASITNVTARAEGDLEYRLHTEAGDGAYGTTGITIEDATGGHELTDISGNGATFYKPVFDVNDDTNSTFARVDAVTGAVVDGEAFYIQFGIDFRSTTPLEVYLGAGTTITSTGNLHGAARLAFFDGATADFANFKNVYMTADATSTSYLSDTTATSTDTSSTGYTAFADDNVLQGDITNKSLKADTESTGDQFSNVLCEVAGTADTEGYYTATITITMWIEGTDPLCVNANVGDEINAILNFYALSE